MFSKIASSLLVLSGLSSLAHAAEVHGASAEGTMGPVAFLWPADRIWDEVHDNSGPCGSPASPSNRTQFPLGSFGSIELTIAEDAYNLAVRVAYGNDPTSQDDFEAIKGNVSELEPGHQCYSVPTPPNTIVAGSNATLQLEYWASDSNKNESFFACADITFVEAASFSEKIVCFNATVSDFVSPDTTSATTSSTVAPETAAPSAEIAPSDSHSSSGLSAGAKAGVAVGTIVGAALLFAVAFFAIRRKRSAAKDAEANRKPMEKIVHDSASIGSDQTAH